MISIKQYLFLVFILSVFVDMLNGYYQLILNTTTIVPLLFKGAILAYSFLLVFKQPKVFMYFVILITLLLLDIGGWIVNDHLNSFSILFNELIRQLYPLGVFFVLWFYKDDISRDDLLHYIMYYGLLMASSVCITAAMGVGASSYGDDFGYGTKGLFVAGNDMSLAILISFCVCSYYLIIVGTLKYVVYSIVFMIVSLLAGSTAIMIGSILICSTIIFLPLIYTIDYSRTFKYFRAVLFFVGFPLILYVMYRITQVDSYTMNKFDIHNILAGNARNVLRDAYYAYASTFNWADMFFGVGPEALYNGVGKELFGYSRGRSIEVDHLTIWGMYGYGLGSLILMYPFPAFCQFIREKNILSLFMLIAISLFFFHGIFAGHAYTSTSAQVSIVAIIVVAYQIYYVSTQNN